MSCSLLNVEHPNEAIFFGEGSPSKAKDLERHREDTTRIAETITRFAGLILSTNRSCRSTVISYWSKSRESTWKKSLDVPRDNLPICMLFHREDATRATKSTSFGYVLPIRDRVRPFSVLPFTCDPVIYEY